MTTIKTPTTPTRLTTTTLLALTCVLAACDTEQPDDALALTDEDVETIAIAESDLLAPGSQAVPVAGVSYSCEIDVGSAWTDCDPAYVDAGEQDPSEWTAKVRMQEQANFRRMDIFAEICDPTEFAFSVSDSPTTNGWGGDSGTTDHDAEAHLYGAGLHFYSTTDVQTGTFGNHSSLGNAHAGGCQIVHTTVRHQAGTHVGGFGFAGGGSPLTIDDTQGFKLAYKTCVSAADPGRGIGCDYEDPSYADAGYWYFGLNRTVGNGSRDGTGVKRACVVLNDDVSVVPSNCLDDAPISVPPEGTYKFCIEAGSPADMLADCEAGAQTWVGFYTAGTFDYVTMWGDPCPAGPRSCRTATITCPIPAIRCPTSALVVRVRARSITSIRSACSANSDVGPTSARFDARTRRRRSTRSAGRRCS
ncbi:MAG: hypothetical protein HC927_11410 [Deltaproteobacteria bacterium]|nr:hypothetical protein [Deltaproteobacteria bacterium]